MKPSRAEKAEAFLSAAFIIVLLLTWAAAILHLFLSKP